MAGGKGNTKRKILIVEDEPDFLVAIQAVLENNDYTVLVARDGQAGLDMARREMPDLIVLDLMLPKIDGYKVCRMLKFDEKYRSIPIIMLTAKAQDKDKLIGKEVGVDRYIVKSERPEVLLNKIKELLK